jgi:hypothetical protein
MASRALIARLSIASSTWVGSTRAGQRPRVKLGLDMDASAHGALQQIAHADDRLVQVERSRLEPLTAGK